MCFIYVYCDVKYMIYVSYKCIVFWIHVLCFRHVYCVLHLWATVVSSQLVTTNLAPTQDALQDLVSHKSDKNEMVSLQPHTSP